MNSHAEKTHLQEYQEEYLFPYHWCLSGFYRLIYELKVLYAMPYLMSSDRVLDLGGGDGKLASMIADKVKEVWCVDPSERAIRMGEVITEGILNLYFRKMSAEKLDFPDGYFDKIFFIEVIEHIPRDILPQVLKEIRRVLKAGGKLFLSTPNRRNLRARIWGARNIPHKHAYEYSFPELQTLIIKAGFRPLEWRGIYLPPPIPKIEHYANTFPFRVIFRWLIYAGKRFPTLAETIWLAAERQ